jgi:hypothetical protein
LEGDIAELKHFSLALYFFSRGHKVKIQHVQRTGAARYFLNFPAAVAEAIKATKGEGWERLLEDKNTLVLRRSSPLPARTFKPTSPQARKRRFRVGETR